MRFALSNTTTHWLVILGAQSADKCSFTVFQQEPWQKPGATALRGPALRAPKAHPDTRTLPISEMRGAGTG